MSVWLVQALRQTEPVLLASFGSFHETFARSAAIRPRWQQILALQMEKVLMVLRAGSCPRRVRARALLPNFCGKRSNATLDFSMFVRFS